MFVRLGLIPKDGICALCASFGIDFKHAVEFSSFGCVPRFGLLGFRLGQLDQTYRVEVPLSTSLLFGPNLVTRSKTVSLVRLLFLLLATA